MEYFYNGHLRWSFLWENPNCWAAFLACLLAWVWCGQIVCKGRANRLGEPQCRVGSPRRFALPVIALYVTEAGIWFLLLKTYSRGGLVAAVVAMAVFFILRASPSREKIRTVFLNIVPRLAIIGIFCMAVGFASRMSPEYVAQDKSVLNRVDQWKSAAVMISDSPFSGWGHKLSGMMYQNWYQPLSHTTRPVGFVNSYLEVAVEQGSHMLFLVIVCAAALLLITVKLRKVTWVAAAGASLVAWLVANLWSSIWIWSGLWILPGIAAICIIVAAIFFKTNRSNPQMTQMDTDSNRSMSGICVNLRHLWINKWIGNFCASCAFLRLMIVSIAIGIVVWAGIIGAGHLLAGDFSFRARPVARSDAAIVERRGERTKSSELRSEIWVDAAVMGRYYGKTIRTILEDKDCGSFIVYAPWARKANRLERPVNRYVYLGFQAELASTKDSGKAAVVVLHPTVYPPVIPWERRDSSRQTAQNTAQTAEWKLGAPSGQSHGLAARATFTVCLPAFDAAAHNLPWRRWAGENDAKLIFSPQSGVRINPEQNREFWRSLLFNE